MILKLTVLKSNHQIYHSPKANQKRRQQIQIMLSLRAPQMITLHLLQRNLYKMTIKKLNTRKMMINRLLQLLLESMNNRKNKNFLSKISSVKRRSKSIRAAPAVAVVKMIRMRSMDKSLMRTSLNR
jgi:hypothetical protein